MDRLFEVFNTDGTKNREVTQYALLEVEINEHKENISAVVTNLNGMNMFLEYDWLVKHNPEVNWNMGKIWFTRCLKTYRMQHQDILFKTRRIQSIDNQDKGYQEIGKEPDPTNPEDLLDYI